MLQLFSKNILIKHFIYQLFFKLFFLPFTKNKVFYVHLKNIIGFYPRKLNLYQIAFTHKTYKHLGKKNKYIVNNERLEYLGDAVLSMVVAEKLYVLFPYQNEGFLTEMRAKIVSRQQLSNIGKKMGLAPLIKYDKINQRNVKFIETITGNALESLVGAIYIENGFNFTKQFIQTKILNNHIDIQELIENEISFKAKLNRWSQKERKSIEFKVINDEIVNKKRMFTIALLIDNEEILRTNNHSKKNAEELLSEKWSKQFQSEE